MTNSRNATEKKTVYAVVTDRILEQLQQGTVPWHKPWTAGVPKSLATGKPYRGINLLTLGCSPYSSPYWLTYKQAQARGGHVRKGEKSWPVVFWKWIDGKPATDSDSQVDGAEPKTRKVPILRYYRVFNVEQCEGIEAPKTETHIHNPIEICEQLVAGYSSKPTIVHENQTLACYFPRVDKVNVPRPEVFDTDEAYYSVLFHELTHSTGHASRLNRPSIVDFNSFGSHEYSKEELVAELGAAMLCGISGIENRTISSSASYIASWLKVLQGEPRMVVLAAAQAQKAADYIRGIRHEESQAS